MLVKNSKTKFFILLLLLLLSSFLIKKYIRNHPGKKEIERLINSKVPCDRVKGFVALGKIKDTSLYHLFFTDMSDRNVTHCMKYYGKSVLWAKIEALRKITNVEPRLPYDFMSPDLKILEQYKEILFKGASK